MTPMAALTAPPCSSAQAPSALTRRTITSWWSHRGLAHIQNSFDNLGSPALGQAFGRAPVAAAAPVAAGLGAHRAHRRVPLDAQWLAPAWSAARAARDTLTPP